MNRRGLFGCLAGALTGALIPPPKAFAGALVPRGSYTGHQVFDMAEMRDFLDVHPKAEITFPHVMTFKNLHFTPAELLQFGSCPVGEDDGCGPPSDAYSNWFEHLV